MEAIILAGGLGTRLQRVIKDIPKPMARIQGKPFLTYILEYLLQWKIDKIFLSVGYKNTVISGHFGRSFRGVEIEYVMEGKPLGTGGAIRQALPLAKGDDCFVLNGDSYFPADLDAMTRFHRAHQARVTIAVKPMQNIDRYGTVVMRNDTIVQFEEKKKKESGYINGGIYILNRSLLHFLKEFPEAFSFEIDFLSKWTGVIQPAAFISDAYFIDIGTPDDYQRAEQEFNALLGRRADHDHFKNTP